MATKKTQTSNPQEAAINQKQGPRTGNTGTPSKRDDFKAMKSDRSSEKSKLADFVISALENLSPNSAKTTGIKKNVTADGARLPSKYKSPKTKG